MPTTSEFSGSSIWAAREAQMLAIGSSPARSAASASSMPKVRPASLMQESEIWTILFTASSPTGVFQPGVLSSFRITPPSDLMTLLNSISQAQLALRFMLKGSSNPASLRTAQAAITSSKLSGGAMPLAARISEL